MVSTIIIITLGILLILQNRNQNTDYKKMYERLSKMYDELNKKHDQLDKMYDESMRLNFKLTRKILELTKEKEEDPDE